MGGRIWLATRMGMHDLRRRPLLLVLLVVTPMVFITRAISLTQRIPRVIGLPGGATVLTTMRDIHGAVMAAITVAFLGGLIGVFTMQAAKQADRRLVLAGFRGVETVVARLIVLALTITPSVPAVSRRVPRPTVRTRNKIEICDAHVPYLRDVLHHRHPSARNDVGAKPRQLAEAELGIARPPSAS